jgi:glutamyl-tRNA reductase
VLVALSHCLTNKLLHGPTQALHDAQAPERHQLREFIARLFNLRGR